MSPNNAINKTIIVELLMIKTETDIPFNNLSGLKKIIEILDLKIQIANSNYCRLKVAKKFFCDAECLIILSSKKKKDLDRSVCIHQLFN